MSDQESKPAFHDIPRPEDWLGIAREEFSKFGLSPKEINVYLPDDCDPLKVFAWNYTRLRLDMELSEVLRDPLFWELGNEKWDEKSKSDIKEYMFRYFKPTEENAETVLQNVTYWVRELMDPRGTVLNRHMADTLFGKQLLESVSNLKTRFNWYIMDEVKNREPFVVRRRWMPDKS